MFLTNEHYTFEDFPVGTAVACQYNGSKFLGIVTFADEDYLSIHWEGEEKELCRA